MFKKGLSKSVRYMSILRSGLDPISTRIMSGLARDRFQKLSIGSTPEPTLIAENPVNYRKAKHIDIRYHAIRHYL